MPNCAGQQMLFGRVGRREIEANFGGGALSSDGGVMLVRQVDCRSACRRRSPGRYRTGATRSASPIRCAIYSPSGCTDCAATVSHRRCEAGGRRDQAIRYTPASGLAAGSPHRLRRFRLLPPAPSGYPFRMPVSPSAAGS